MQTIVEYLGVLAQPEVIGSILMDLLAILCVLGVAMLLLLALLGSDASRRKAVEAVVILAPATPVRAQPGAMLHPWEYPIRRGATRGPPSIPPMHQARMATTVNSLPVGAVSPAGRIRIGARC
jgi:hypothetical protein